MSVSFSIWRAVPTEPISACQPEIAPQAIVTKSIGQSGCRAPEAMTCGGPLKPMKPASLKVARSRFKKNARNAPRPPNTMVRAVIQKPM